MYSKYREQDWKTHLLYGEGSRLQRVRFREVPDCRGFSLERVQITEGSV